MPPRKNWCKLCQDDYRVGDIIVRCTSCPKTFHKECLEHDIATSGFYGASDLEFDSGCLDFKNFRCENCLHYVDENEIENDERCKLCKEPNRNEDDVLLLCDGCPNSYHVSCLELQAEPGERWYCPMCNPGDFKAINVREYRRNPLSESADHVNSSICYVCQRPGKLLGCDFCSNSFHHGCLPEFDVGTIGEVWECPCCKGDDPFVNQMHKRWTIQQIDENIKERRKCMALWKSKIFRHRACFLLTHRDELAPFVSEKVMQSLKRNFLGDSSARRRHLKGGRNIEDLLEFFEEEASVEADKFILKAHKSAFYPSGRRMENRPLRAGVSLKPHQEDGVDWLLKSFLTGGAILSDEMGLGKTIQTLCFLSYLKLMKIEGPHLIVVPLSTVGNWLREIHRFTPHLTSIKICGSRTERLHAMEDRLACKGLYDLYITTYETVKSEESFFVETIPRWQCLILDEAHRIKNQSGAARHSMDRVIANMRLLLTGTPLQNNAMELFTLINFMFPDIFKDSAILDGVFATHSAKNRKGNVDSTASETLKKEDLEAIKLLLSRIMLRRLKEQALSLPKKAFHDVWLPLSRHSLHWYRTLMDIRSIMQENVSMKKLLGLVIKMRIVCGHPRGIVSRPYQTEKLFEFFKQENLCRQNEVEIEAEQLRGLEGEEHIIASAKLTFLDKLLQQLHFENCTFVPGYLSQFSKHLKELEASAEHRRKIKKKSGNHRIDSSRNSSGTFCFITSPSPTANDTYFLVHELQETNFSNTFPYKRMNIVSQAELREKIRRQESNVSAKKYCQEADNFGDVSLESNRTSFCGRNKIILSDDEEFPIDREDGIKSTSANTFSEEERETCTKKKGVFNPLKEVTMHKILVFTQFQLVLDELESYCNCRGWKYMRLDGSTNKLIRELDIREFNSPGSPYFVYLISTRAGGLGINLTAANHVVLFDEDWNPFIDLQAIDRAHRIGQRRDVHVWKLISEWTVEERMALRREQKLRLDKLLMNSNQPEIGYDDVSEVPTMTLNQAEILKMMLHGNEALKNMECEEIVDFPLDYLVNRGRKKPPDGLDDCASVESLAEEGDVNSIRSTDASTFIDVGEIMKEEDMVNGRIEQADNLDGSANEDVGNEMGMGDESVSFDGTNLFNGSDVLDHKQVKRLLSNKEGRDELLKQLKNAGLLWRSGRERKRPCTMYIPDAWRKRSETRQIRHETRCFCCGFPKNHKSSYKNKNDEILEVDYGELVPCFRCPKSYHRFCERLTGDLKKTWTCRWHECCLCFRKSSQCDNLLIHCSSCPTSFCYDCFPPDYTRHYVGDDYYYSLKQRGMNANSQNWIFFLCSKCKIHQEHENRRKMTREEREIQQKQQKEIRNQLLTSVSSVEREAKKRSREDRRLFIESLKAAELELENRIREGYQGLFPPNLIEQIVRRIETARLKKESDEKAGITKTKREVNFIATKLPAKLLALCENCKLPFHNTARYPGECPYPKELVRVDSVSTKTESTKDHGSAKTEETNVKTYKRTACAKCFQTQSGRLAHTRRHCDLLNAEEKLEYTQRRNNVERALSKLKERTATSPNGTDYSILTHAKLKSVYSTFLDQCDRILEQVFRDAGLKTYTIRMKDGDTEEPKDGQNSTASTSNLQSYIYSPNICNPPGGKPVPFILPPLVLPNVCSGSRSNFTRENSLNLSLATENKEHSVSKFTIPRLKTAEVASAEKSTNEPVKSEDFTAPSREFANCLLYKGKEEH